MENPQWEYYNHLLCRKVSFFPVFTVNFEGKVYVHVCSRSRRLRAVLHFKFNVIGASYTITEM